MRGYLHPLHVRRLSGVRVRLLSGISGHQETPRDIRCIDPPGDSGTMLLVGFCRRPSGASYAAWPRPANFGLAAAVRWVSGRRGPDCRGDARASWTDQGETGGAVSRTQTPAI